MAYLVEGNGLTSVANAIRNKGGTNLSLTFPSGFISAINDISAGNIIDKIINKTIGGTYTNSNISNVGSNAFY